jgi:hypothetical protein
MRTLKAVIVAVALAWNAADAETKTSGDQAGNTPLVGAWQATGTKVVGVDGEEAPLILIVNPKNAYWCPGQFPPLVRGVVRIEPNCVVWQRDGMTEKLVFEIVGPNLNITNLTASKTLPATRFVRLAAVPPDIQEITSPFTFGSTQPQPSDVKTLGDELQRRLRNDQAVRRNGSSSSTMRKTDRENTAWLKKIVRHWGWIDASRFGVKAADAAFLLVQHSGDLEFMTAALPEIEEDVKARRLSDGQSYALLYDRLQIMRGGKQRYGSQIIENAQGEMVVSPLENRDKVDEYREEMGMEPLAKYLSLFVRDGKKVVFADDAPAMQETGK